jgi:superfamily II DNA or RNA helicase
MTLSLEPWNIKLRDWQQRAFERISEHTKRDFLAMATPGAGKTRVALRIAHDLLQRKAATRVVVICPTNHLRQQWARAAHEAGIRLDPSLSNDQAKENRDYHGCVVTYQQVCLSPTVYRLACRQSPTMAIFDELHHAGDGKDWGEALREAFGHAVRRLALSGTPFRTDNNPIPFVTYENEQSAPDFSYGYREALAEKVCRPIVFPTYEGDLSWVSRGKEVTARFADQLGRRKQQERLKTALMHDEWVNSVIKDADAELTNLRKQHAAAGGLLIAMDQDHARHLAAQIKTMTGTPARVAISDDPMSTKIIERFANSKERWLIAVNMVSEGVDIPRLRVGVYATNVQTEMYFRQVVGRFVRMQGELPSSQRAYLYLPRDPRLVEYAEAIKAERDHVLIELARAEPRTLFDVHPNEVEPFIPLRGVALVHGRIGDEEEEVASEVGAVTPQRDTVPLHERKEQLRQTHKGLVIQVAQRSGIEHRRINLELVRRTGSRIENASLDQLKRRIKQLERWIEHGYSERR